jgi:hypothetical protein
MPDITINAELVARCGLYCGACKAYLGGKCPGCHENAKATWCKVRTCCTGKGIATCAECSEFADPRACGKFNNVISKLFGLVFRSDRAACIEQIRGLGIEGHARTMAESRRHSIKR